MEEKVKWEYKIVELYDYVEDGTTEGRNQMLLDALGLDRWELVTIKRNWAYLKRRVIDKTNPQYIDNDQLKRLSESGLI